MTLPLLIDMSPPSKAFLSSLFSAHCLSQELGTHFLPETLGTVSKSPLHPNGLSQLHLAVRSQSPVIQEVQGALGSMDFSTDP